MKDFILKGLKLLVWIVSFPLVVLVLGAFMPILHKPHISKQRTIYSIDFLSRAAERYNATHVNQLKLSEDGEVCIELRNPLCVKNGYTVGRFGYEEDRPVKVSVTRSLEDKEVEVTSTGSMLEIIWKKKR